MTRKATTKDELFLIKLYEKALLQGNPEMEVDRYVIGRLIGQNNKGINTIVILLAQANFVKKGTDSAVYLTPHGLKLIHQLLKG